MTAPVERALQYERDILEGSIASSEHTMLAVQRSVQERARTDWDWQFDAELGNKVVRWIEKLKFAKGRWAGQPVILQGWQCWIVVNAFGWVSRSTGLRRFRYIYIEVARKNGKSELLAAIALYLLAADREKTPEVYCVATSRDQATIVYDRANKMRRSNPELAAYYGLTHYGSQFSDQAMYCDRSDGVFKPMAWTPEKLDGFHIHGAIVDEFHAHPSDAMWDVLETGTGAREQSMMWAITTSGKDIGGVCFGYRRYLTRVLRGQAEGERVFGCIWCIDWEYAAKERNDSWHDEDVWIKANPNLGVSQSLDDLRTKADKAKSMTTAAAAFLTKHMSVWIRGAHAWMQMDKFAACKAQFDWADFHDEDVWVGVDIGTVKDITSMAYTFKRDGRYWLKWRNYIPAAAVENSRVAQLQDWIAQGWVEEVPGSMLDYGVLEAQFERDTDDFNVKGLGYDPWEAKPLIKNLDEEYGTWIEIVRVNQNGPTMSDPMKHFEAMVLADRIRWDGNPATEWMFSNVIALPRPNDNVMPGKPEDEARIDAAVAAIISYSIASVAGEEWVTGVDTLADAEPDADADGEEW